MGRMRGEPNEIELTAAHGLFYRVVRRRGVSAEVKRKVGTLGPRLADLRRGVPAEVGTLGPRLADLRRPREQLLDHARHALAEVVALVGVGLDVKQAVPVVARAVRPRRDVAVNPLRSRVCRGSQARRRPAGRAARRAAGAAARGREPARVPRGARRSACACRPGSRRRSSAASGPSRRSRGG